MSPQQNNIFVGAFFALLATLCFSINDALIKGLSDGYALHQIVLVRSITGVALLLLIVVPLSGGYVKLRTNKLGWHIIRGLCVVWANLFFYMGLADLELAEAVGIFFVAPFLISIFSVIFLGERVGPWRWVAIAIGFAGVLLIVRPGTDAFRLSSVLPMLAACGYASFHVLTRKLSPTENLIAMTFYPPVVFVFVSGAVGLALGSGVYAGSASPSIVFLTLPWVMPSWGDLATMALIGVGVTAGGAAISQAYRMADAAVIAPFEYTALIWAALFGLLFFAEWPDRTALLGMAIVLVSGLFMVWRETVNARVRKLPPNTVR
ncbi:MAG: DMT family transporter [Pseudomonadota bacterium]